MPKQPGLALLCDGLILSACQGPNVRPGDVSARSGLLTGTGGTDSELLTGTGGTDSELLTGTGGTEKDRLLSKISSPGGASFRFGLNATAQAVFRLEVPRTGLSSLFSLAATGFAPVTYTGVLVYQLKVAGSTRRFLVSENELGPDHSYRLVLEGLSAGDPVELDFDTELYANPRSRTASVRQTMQAGTNAFTLRNLPALLSELGQPAVVKKKVDPQAVYPNDDVNFLANVSIPDNQEVQPGASFEKIWAIQNAGQRVWEDRTVANQEPAGCVNAGSLAAPAKVLRIPRSFPGEVIVLKTRLTAPQTPGTYHSAWKYQELAGRQVFPGLPGMRAQVRVTEPASPLESPLELTPLYTDSRGQQVPLPENLLIPASQPFELIWKVRNPGAEPQPPMRLLNLDQEVCQQTAFLKPDQPELQIPALAPGAETQIKVSLTAPKLATTVRSNWELRTAAKQPTTRAFVQLTVDQAWPLRVVNN
ncbi:MAG TPA: NBR1-Ig-like domain-containing protein [Candidatus Obscuribacterales bacterium]